MANSAYKGQKKVTNTKIIRHMGGKATKNKRLSKSKLQTEIHWIMWLNVLELWDLDKNYLFKCLNKWKQRIMSNEDSNQNNKRALEDSLNSMLDAAEEKISE